jgi:hypothetical protein
MRDCMKKSDNTPSQFADSGNSNTKVPSPTENTLTYFTEPVFVPGSMKVNKPLSQLTAADVLPGLYPEDVASELD